MIRRSLVLLVLAAVAASGFAFAQGDAFTLRVHHTALDQAGAGGTPAARLPTGRTVN